MDQNHLELDQTTGEIVSFNEQTSRSITQKIYELEADSVTIDHEAESRDKENLKRTLFS